MTPVAAAALQSWTLRPWLFGALLLTGAVYLRGWLRVRRQMPERFPAWRLAAFQGGLAVVVVATASPLDAFGGLLLQVHMIQHLLLTMVAPPLVWLGWPATPLLRGLPPAVRRDGLGPFLASSGLGRLAGIIAHPVVCWTSFVVAMWLWHVPALYQLALRSPPWHQVEHASFLVTALLFWWPVVQPRPSRPHWPRWTMIPYLLLADVQNTVFSAWLTFAERVVYPAYAAAPRLGGLTALDDQVAAGVIMWVPGSVLFLVPVGWVVTELLGPVRTPHRASRRGRRTGDGTAARRRAWDLLATPAIGRALRSPVFRRVARTAMLLLAAAIVADGLLGPQMSPMNLAGVLPWTYWRGLGVVALLAAGNFFCMACPFMLPRDLGRRFLPARWRWPRPLRSKWLAVAVVLAYLWAYEVFDLWDSPRATAWIVAGYFAAAFVVDGLFRRASFCKYLCPIGQFHFVGSLVSPLEVRVRDPAVCRSCRTFDCIRGNAGQRGCELGLFQPKKVGSFDCTFCLDCVDACPHQNVGILAVAPGTDLIRDPYRSSLGRWSKRPDIAALVLVLVFGAFVNAAAMVEPVAGAARAGSASGVPGFTWLLAGVVVAAPVIAGACGALGRALGGAAAPWRELTCRFVLSLVPLGFGMWCAHFLFHLLGGAGTAVPVVQRAAAGVGLRVLGEPAWGVAALAAPAGWLVPLEVLLLDLGLLLTLYVGWRIACGYRPSGRRALGLLLPWASLATALWVAGVWILLQPMEMRGMMVH